MLLCSAPFLCKGLCVLVQCSGQLFFYSHFIFKKISWCIHSGCWYCTCNKEPVVIHQLHKINSAPCWWWYLLFPPQHVSGTLLLRFICPAHWSWSCNCLYRSPMGLRLMFESWRLRYKRLVWESGDCDRQGDRWCKSGWEVQLLTVNKPTSQDLLNLCHCILPSQWNWHKSQTYSNRMVLEKHQRVVDPVTLCSSNQIKTINWKMNSLLK